MKNNYQDWSKKNLIKEIETLKKRKKYGLVWEEKKEDVVEQCKKELPILKEVKNKEIITDKNKPVNLLIEGDNYHALSVLNYTHKGKIDGIYIDPPYNTGARDWTYNNHYIDKEDPYRHTKYLSLMSHRITIAKNLLKQDGIICVTIDDNEMSRLWLLMEEIFGEFRHLGTIVIRNNPAGRSTIKGVSVTHEYALFFGRSNRAAVGCLKRSKSQKDRYDQKDAKGSFEWVNFRKPGSMRSESPKMFYPILATEKYLKIPKMNWDSDKEQWELLHKPNDEEKIIYPIDNDGKERRWRWGTERAKKEIGELKVMNQKGELHIYVRGRVSKEGVLPMTWWNDKKYSSTAYGTNLLKSMFSDLQVFSYPKSIFAVQDCIKVITEKKNALILDFFAGSGTTGHAVLGLNKEDKGNRQFILCTNNEDNNGSGYKIAEDICYPRIKKVIKGYKNLKGKKIEGLSGNLKYFKTNFVGFQEPTDINKTKLTKQATEMLCMKEGTFEKIIDARDFKIFKNSKHYTGVIYDQLAIPRFKKEIEKFDGKFSVYIFSLEDETFDEEFEDVKQKIKLSPIPEAILRVYKRIFK